TAVLELISIIISKFMSLYFSSSIYEDTFLSSHVLYNATYSFKYIILKRSVVFHKLIMGNNNMRFSILCLKILKCRRVHHVEKKIEFKKIIKKRCTFFSSNKTKPVLE
ncbi:hypothetical protein L9F63_001019, partial [Diploptera punctata]